MEVCLYGAIHFWERLTVSTGWNFGNLDTDDYYLRILCVDLQIAIVNVEYRYVLSFLSARLFDDVPFVDSPLNIRFPQASTTVILR